MLSFQCHVSFWGVYSTFPFGAHWAHPINHHQRIHSKGRPSIDAILQETHQCIRNEVPILSHQTGFSRVRIAYPTLRLESKVHYKKRKLCQAELSELGWAFLKGSLFSGCAWWFRSGVNSYGVRIFYLHFPRCPKHLLSPLQPQKTTCRKRSFLIKSFFLTIYIYLI